jgi:hypothetical protein
MAMMRLAALMAWLAGLGFGVPAAYGAFYYAEHGFLWTFMGFPTMAAGPLFESVGLHTSAPLMVAFTVVCAGEIILGVLLWMRRRSAAVMSLALLPVEFAFWIGFVLPFGPVFGIARLAFVLMAWRTKEKAALPRT